MKKILSLCGVLALSACINTASLNGEYKMLNAPENAEITIGFEGDRYFGNAAINRYFGSFEKERNQIKFGPSGATMMAGPENLMKAERQYLQDLSKITSYTLDGDTLTLTGDGTVLTFEKQKKGK